VEDTPLVVSKSNRVAILAMNRPAAKNSLDPSLLAALTAALADVSADRDIRAIVLTGSGGSFCAGADLKQAMSQGIGGDMSTRVDEFHAVIKAIVAAPQPIVAAIDGAAVGFGADLALACDLRIMSSRAYLQEKFVQIGLMPDGGGTFWLPRLVGIGRAMELMMLGTKIVAEHALSLGLTNRVVAPEELDAAARALAQDLADGPPLAIAAIKRAVRASLADSLENALGREKASQLELLRTQDVMAGVLGWMQGKKPEFSGR
jgi:2-(1,2-epoxy-1,2-dihydrophenyl)acetyl-CoA isomerase